MKFLSDRRGLSLVEYIVGGAIALAYSLLIIAPWSRILFDLAQP